MPVAPPQIPGQQANSQQADSQQVWGLQLWRGPMQPMQRDHRHSELELNFLCAGQASYLFSHGIEHLQAPQLVLFWGALSHRLLFCQPDTECIWLTLPLANFLRFQLPAQVVQQLLQGQVLRFAGPEQARQQQTMLEQWLQDQQTAGLAATWAAILQLEFEAFLRRAAGQANGLTANPGPKPAPKPTANGSHSSPAGLARALALAEVIHQQANQAIGAAEIAAAASLAPAYAAQLFKQHFGMTITAYLTLQRLAQAQNLLATSDLRVLDIAFESGFGSVNRFYDVFAKHCGCTPLQYRQNIRQKL
jgi:AraC family transcriptional regulator, melibiose operon regulatory protein